MLVKRSQCLELLVDPESGKPLFDGNGSPTGVREFPFSGELPVIVDFEKSVLDEGTFIGGGTVEVVERREYSGIQKLLRGLVGSKRESTVRRFRRFVDEVRVLNARPRILVVGGGEVGHGMEEIYADTQVELVAFDIYPSRNIQFIADAHQIPLGDGSVDGVVVQAVLEHVLDPKLVVREIYRVLRDGGCVFAETPFLQQVHEGAYDFTRFTESGHRFLFRNFELISSGATTGPGTQMLWSIDYLFRSMFRSRLAGKAAKVLFAWLKYLDGFIPEDYKVDSNTGVYFLGRKSNSCVGPKEIIKHYKGSQTR